MGIMCRQISQAYDAIHIYNNKVRKMIMMTPTNKCSLAILLALITTAVSTQAWAAGFALIEFSGSGMGNAFAGGAASAEDASTVQFNPAGMSLIEKDQVVGVLHLITPNAAFSSNESTLADGLTPLSGNSNDGGRNALVPNFYWVKEINDKMKFGLGVNTPFGLATQYDDTWVGRYHAVESDVKTVNINPSISYRIDDNHTLGLGVSAQYAHVTLSSAIDFGTLAGAPQQHDGFATLTADNWGYGWNIGWLYEFSDETRLGAAYRSEVKQDTKGNADFMVPESVAFVTSSGAFVDTGLTADITLPDSLSVSMAHQYNTEFELLADITWTGWSDFEELRIVYNNPLQPNSVTTENWDDSLRYSVGINYQMDEKLKLRGGLAYDASPIPSAVLRTPRLPSDKRIWLAFGAQYKWDTNLTLDVGYTHLFISNTNINNTFESSIPALAATIKGEYAASVDILSTQLTWTF